jgi:hypothetical protein
MRDAAVRALAAASRRGTLWPLNDLVRLLAFESGDHAREFVMAYALPCEDDNVPLENEVVKRGPHP